MNDSRSYQLFRGVERLFYAPKDLEGFYVALGCPLLSSLVKEEYHTGVEVTGHRNCVEVRDLVLTRLPLFLDTFHKRDLHERLDWLKDTTETSHFSVKVYKKVFVKRVLKFGKQRVEKESEVSAGFWQTSDHFELMMTESRDDYFE